MKNGSYLRYAMALLIVLATVVIVCTWLKPAEEQIPVITPVGESGKIWEKPSTNAAATDNYQLIIGANPRLNKKQIFSPPSSSVVITNGEKQLRQLIEQEKRTRQNTNNPR